MDDELPKKPKDFVLGGDLERHSVDELQALEGELERELARVRAALVARRDVRAAAEAFFKRARPAEED